MNTRVDFHFLLQGIFPTQGLNRGLLHCRQILYHLSNQGSPANKVILSSRFYQPQNTKIESMGRELISPDNVTRTILRILWSKVTQSYPTLCDPKDCSIPGSSVHEIFQARVLEWVAFAFSRGSSPPRDRTWVSHIVGRRFTIWATREVKNFIDII